MIGFPKPQKREKKRYRLNPRGKKTTQWEKCKQLLRPAFAEAHIGTCEIGPVLYLLGYDKEVEKHRHWFFLNWAHGKKRNSLVQNELLTLVALTCVDCHDFIEPMPADKMLSIVQMAIARRKIHPVTENMEVPAL